MIGASADFFFFFFPFPPPVFKGCYYDIPNADSDTFLSMDLYADAQLATEYPLWRVFLQRYGGQWFSNIVMGFLQEVAQQNPFHCTSEIPFYDPKKVPKKPQYIMFLDEIDKMPASTMKGNLPLNFAHANAIT